MDLAQTLRWMDAALGGAQVSGVRPTEPELHRLQTWLKEEGHPLSLDQVGAAWGQALAPRESVEDWRPTIAGRPDEPPEARDWGWVFAKIRQDRLRRGDLSQPVSTAEKTALRWALVNKGAAQSPHVPVPAWFEQRLTLASPRDWPALLDCLAPLIRHGTTTAVDWPLAETVMKEVCARPDQRWPWDQVRWALPPAWHVETWSRSWGSMSLVQLMAATHRVEGLVFLEPRLGVVPGQDMWTNLWDWACRPFEPRRGQHPGCHAQTPEAHQALEATRAWLQARVPHPLALPKSRANHPHPFGQRPPAASP